jgi:Asp-tRNA(Asn)/Glu-tRNA(Gln) amidotransferase A subunit family amidase
VDSTAWLSGVAVAALIRSGELRPADVVEEAIARIEAANPELACVVIPLFERARERVDSVDLDEPFAGVPMLLKDAGEELAGTPTWGRHSGTSPFGSHLAIHDGLGSPIRGTWGDHRREERLP